MRAWAQLFEGHPGSVAVYARLAAALDGLASVEERVTKSQVAMRTSGRAFAYAWRPGQYVNSSVPVVLSLVLAAPTPSPRFKEVVHPSRRVWLHHLELRRPDDVDDEVRGWLRRAYDEARSGG